MSLQGLFIVRSPPKEAKKRVVRQSTMDGRKMFNLVVENQQATLDLQAIKARLQRLQFKQDKYKRKMQIFSSRAESVEENIKQKEKYREDMEKWKLTIYKMQQSK